MAKTGCAKPECRLGEQRRRRPRRRSRRRHRAGRERQGPDLLRRRAGAIPLPEGKRARDHLEQRVRRRSAFRPASLTLATDKKGGGRATAGGGHGQGYGGTTMTKFVRTVVLGCTMATLGLGCMDPAPEG